ncbi:murein L,D-transpeptidase catalytic domain-containing protein [Flavobacterium selenitireducens]|uniref:murein L,D-transpeptidase catalytic domain-containing protein n=1 Tax=Flavobacterium selenitireducens TaxID=2722704 RepID=UPI00168A9B61|nr:murein L,D-transpeptidase catalytic domain family protein [Flavobacterium selenitireducens]MBD3582419.1 peptidase [Flavobacterium selenitireducens]
MKLTFLLGILPFICCNSADTWIVEKKSGNDYSSRNLEALDFCRKSGFNDSYYFLVDLSEHSGKNRFFIYDFTQKKIVEQKLVTHGSCDVPEQYADRWQKARFSNTADSHCSALGKYKVGARDKSGWGIKVKYWLHGLERTNDNAQTRLIVLHSWEAVADKEIFPDYSPLSWGCPAVSDAFMERLDARLQTSKKPVLLWIIA